MEPVVLSEPPSVLRGYLRALQHVRRPVRAVESEPLAFELREVPLTSAFVEDLQELFGAPRRAGVPLTAPHVLAGALQLRVVTDPDFPLRILGAVHVRSVIEQVGEVRVGARARLRVSLGELRTVEKGTEHDLVTEMFSDGELVWRGLSTNLTLDPATTGSSRGAPPTLPEAEYTASFDAPRGIGRRYGRMSGDRNPIHLSRVTARLFGFKRAIAHGMWTVGRSLVVLGHDTGAVGDRLEVRFKRPLLLPGRAVLRWNEAAATTQFWAVAASGPTVFVEGTLARGQAGAVRGE